MFGKQITLFRLFGFKVKVDMSWLILAFLVIWSLATGIFPYYFPGLSETAYWWMGIAGAIGLFLSIITHELFHSLFARRFGLPMKGITLFIFGGVAEMDEEAPSPKAEFYMSIIGPIVSIILGGIFYGIYRWGYDSIFPKSISAIFYYLSIINVMLAGFNILPAFPLDGGRVLRAIIWHVKGDLQSATRIATTVSNIFAYIIIAFGIISILSGNFIGGIWYVVIGIFLKNASQMSYRSTIIRKALEGESVERFVNRNPVTVPSDITIDTLVNEYIYKYHYKMFPVTDKEGRLSGCITTNQIKNIPRDEWPVRKINDLSVSCSPDNVVSSDTDVMKIFSLMSKSKNSRLLVVDNSELTGVLTLKDMLDFLKLKLDLEGSDTGIKDLDNL